jgi:hypothetical protein
LEIAITRDKLKLETLTLTGARVTRFAPFGMSRNDYLATLSLAAGTVEDFDDKGLSYNVSLWEPKGNKKESTLRRDWSTTHNRVAEFAARHISVPPVPPLSEPLRNEVATGRLFQAIQVRKELNIIVNGGPGRQEQDATHRFLLAQKAHLAYDLQILLHRSTLKQGRVLKVDVDDEGPLPVYIPVREVRTEYESLASLKLARVQVKDFLPIEKGAYVARLKATGGTQDELLE